MSKIKKTILVFSMMLGFFFASPQTASAGNDNKDVRPVSVTIIRDREAKTTIIYTFLENGSIDVSIRNDDGTTYSFTINPND